MYKVGQQNSGCPEVTISYRTRKLIPGTGETSSSKAADGHEAKHADRKLTLHVQNLSRNGKSFNPD
jgi:dsRNA-specific ribonuclease